MSIATCPQCNQSKEPQIVSFSDYGFSKSQLALDPWGIAYTSTELYRCSCCNFLFLFCPHCFKAQTVTDISESGNILNCLYCYRVFQSYPGNEKSQIKYNPILLYSFCELNLPLQLRDKCFDSSRKTVCSVNDLPKKEGCYLLTYMNYVVYVGQSEDLKKRWQTHNLRQEIKNLIKKKGVFSSPFQLYYYLINGRPERYELEDFFNRYYSPVLSKHKKFGDISYIILSMNSDFTNGKITRILFYLETYYKELEKKKDRQYRCSRFYENYHRFYGSYESSNYDILQISKTKKCIDISPFFSSFTNPNDSLIYAKFDI